MKILATQLNDRHLGRWVKIKGSRRKPETTGILTKFVWHVRPNQERYARSKWADLTIGGEVRSVPWYRVIIVFKVAE